MKKSQWLSVCVPTFNRSQLLLELLASIEHQGRDDIEIVIVDDGSTDGSENAVMEFASRTGADVVYEWQENAGRAAALHKAVSRATGKYSVIMDSDDYFLEGAFAAAAAELALIENDPSIAGVVFNTVRKDGTLIGSGFPSDRLRSNLVGIYADHKVTGDKKEVIRTALMQAHLYKKELGVRRVPTSMIWTRLASRHDCIFVNKAIVAKDYLEGGMTGTLSQLKRQNLRPMLRLHWARLVSLKYRSLGFRLRSAAAVASYAGRLLLMTLGKKP